MEDGFINRERNKISGVNFGLYSLSSSRM